MSKKEILALVDYMKAKKRAECAVCQLPDAIREQLAEASSKKIKVRDQLEWLTEVVGAEVNESDLVSHRSARHGT